MPNDIIQYRCPIMINKMNYQSGRNPEVLVKMDGNPLQIICPNYLGRGICDYEKADHDWAVKMANQNYKEDESNYNSLHSQVEDKIRKENDNSNPRLHGKALEEKLKQTFTIELEKAKRDALSKAENLNQKCFLTEGFKPL